MFSSQRQGIGWEHEKRTATAYSVNKKTRQESGSIRFNVIRHPHEGEDTLVSKILQGDLELSTFIYESVRGTRGTWPMPRRIFCQN